MSHYYKPHLLSLVLIYFDTLTIALRIEEKYFKFRMNIFMMHLCKTFPAGGGCSWWYIVTEAGQLSLLFLHLLDQDNRTVMGQ